MNIKPTILKVFVSLVGGSLLGLIAAYFIFAKFLLGSSGPLNISTLFTQAVSQPGFLLKFAQYALSYLPVQFIATVFAGVVLVYLILSIRIRSRNKFPEPSETTR